MALPCSMLHEVPVWRWMISPQKGGIREGMALTPWP